MLRRQLIRLNADDAKLNMPIRSSREEFVEHYRDFPKEANNNRTYGPRRRKGATNETSEGKKKREKGGGVGEDEASDEERGKEGKK